MNSIAEATTVRLLLAILLLAAALRLLGIDFGLPYIYHTDEWFEIKRALKLGAGVYDFERAFKGGYFYLLFVEYGFYYALQTLLGHFQDSKDLLRELFTDPTNIWLIGRITTATIGVINCWLIFLLGRRIHSPLVGLIAALLLAVNPIHSESSHYTTVDIPLACLLTLAMLLMTPKTHQSADTLKTYVLLAITLAAAMMNKITAIVAFVSVAAFHIDNQLKRDARFSPAAVFNRPFFAFCGVFLAAYIIGNPAIIYHAKDIVLMAASFVDREASEAFVAEAYPQPERELHRSVFYLSALFPTHHLFLAALFAAGSITAVLTTDRIAKGTHITLQLFGFSYFAFLALSASEEHIYERYLLPIVPLVSLYAAIGIATLVAFISRKQRSHAAGIAVAAVIIAAASIPGLIDAGVFSYRKTLPDNRTLAKDWVYQNVAAGRKIILQGQGFNFTGVFVPLNLTPENLDEVLTAQLHGESKGNNKDTFYTVLSEVLSESHTYDITLIYNTQQLKQALARRDADYIIVSDRFIALNTLEKNRRKFPQLAELTQWALSDAFILAKDFPAVNDPHGPSIKIFSRR